MWQKAGEIQAFRALQRGAEKWCKEHLQRKGPVPISEEGRDLLEDKERWGNQTSFLSEYHESRKRERINEDGSFKQHQKGPITSTYTTPCRFESSSLYLSQKRRSDTLRRSLKRPKWVCTQHTFISATIQPDLQQRLRSRNRWRGPSGHISLVTMTRRDMRLFSPNSPYMV